MGADVNGTGKTFGSEGKEDAFMERLHVKEQELHQHSVQLDESLKERQSIGILEAGSKWEDHILGKVDEVIIHEEQKLDEATQIRMQEYMENLEETARQRQLSTKAAWMLEVASTQILDTLTEKLKTFHDVQKATIEEFVTVQTQNLEMDLDAFHFHAQETLHAGIFGPDMPNPRAQYVNPPRGLFRWRKWKSQQDGWQQVELKWKSQQDGWLWVARSTVYRRGTARSQWRSGIKSRARRNTWNKEQRPIPIHSHQHRL